MIVAILRNVIGAALTLLAATLVVFVVGHLTGDPSKVLVSADTATPEQIAQIRAQLGLDQPLYKQYVDYLGDLVHGDFGESYQTRQPVSDVLSRRIGPSLKLGAASVVVALLVSIPLGVLSATHRGRRLDRLVRASTLFGQAIPSFWLGLMFVLIFAVRLHWLPAGGDGDWTHYVLPALTVGWLISSGIVRLLRSSMIEVLGSDYVQFAQSYGMPRRRVVWTWALRNALIPVVTFIGFMFSIIVAGTVVVEVVFAWPGLGRLSYEAVLARDFPTLQAVVLIWAALAIVGALIADLAYLVLDPRIRR